jgi:hypothetical protein
MQKPKKDKSSKDELLNQILQEINDENNEISDDIYIDKIVPVPKTKLSKIREMQKKRQWIVIVILVISIIYLLFNTATESTQREELQTNNDIYTIPNANQRVTQKEEPELLDVLKEEAKNHNIIEETNPIQIIQENPPEEKEVYTEVQTVMKVKDPQTAREKAKEALFMQMQN